MHLKTLVKTSEYHDSVSLMRLARDLSAIPGIEDAAVIMATDANKALLASAGLLDTRAKAARANDLVIAVRAASETLADQALAKAIELLRKKVTTQETGIFRPRSLHSALAQLPEANLAIISVAGRYAADEAWGALQKGLHVLLFSDNVTIEDEIALKRFAVERGLLLMGPGAGTALINGTALGFANVIRRGPVGIVSAAGTGLQEVSTLLCKFGSGVSQGIGTGGRDLKEEVGGLMMLAGLRALQNDPDTQVLVLVSKPPAASVFEEVLDQVAQGYKPAVVCFLGGDPRLVQVVPNATPARTLQEAALIAARLTGVEIPELSDRLARQENNLLAQASELRNKLAPEQKFLRGLFSGGTLCYEAQVLWQELLTSPVLSNAPLHSQNRLPDSTISQGHSAIDLGEEEFTVGRPHPMIDNDLRIRRLLQEASDPQTALVMLDVVLGFGAHPDPASELAPAILQARHVAQEAQGELIVVASVTGTANDPQGLERQTQALQQAGVIVCESNAAAACLAAHVVRER